jgi:hypothetical protein
MLYGIYDIYDGEYEWLGTVTDVNTYEQAYDIFMRRFEDTDGECCLTYRPESPEDVNTAMEFDIGAALEQAEEDY